MIRAALIVFLALIGGVTPTWSQYFQCPPGSTQMGGSPIWCQCPDGSAASIYGCPQARPQAPPARPQIPPGATRCGSGYCDAGKKCMRNGRQCMNRDAVDCGTYACSANWSCSVGTCMPPGAIHCGDGFCPSWQKCINHRCLSAEEQQQRGGLLKRILTRIIELNPANPMRGYELYSGQKLSTSLQQQSIGSPPQVQQSIGSPPRVWNPAIGQMLNDPYVGQPVTPGSQLRPQSPPPRERPAYIPPPPPPQTGCGAGMREVTNGTFTYCELFMERPSDALPPPAPPQPQWRAPPSTFGPPR